MGEIIVIILVLLKATAAVLFLFEFGTADGFHVNRIPGCKGFTGFLIVIFFVIIIVIIILIFGRTIVTTFGAAATTAAATATTTRNLIQILSRIVRVISNGCGNTVDSGKVIVLVQIGKGFTFLGHVVLVRRLDWDSLLLATRRCRSLALFIMVINTALVLLTKDISVKVALVLMATVLFLMLLLLFLVEGRFRHFHHSGETPRVLLMTARRVNNSFGFAAAIAFLHTTTSSTLVSLGGSGSTATTVVTAIHVFLVG